jgi:hypothetical protein
LPHGRYLLLVPAKRVPALKNPTILPGDKSGAALVGERLLLKKLAGLRKSNEQIYNLLPENKLWHNLCAG